jgi:hypothetical protein
MPYSYTERDLLTEPPYHYMFSPFEGSCFLAEYVAARESACRRYGLAALRAVRAEAIEPLPAIGAGPIATESLLSQLVDVVRSGESRGVRDWVDVFARKFEVSKRLRRSYGADLKPLDRTPLDRNAYAQLAFLVASVVRDAGELRLLNALIKLNDLVLSAPELDDEAAALIGPAINRELALVREIARRLHVSMAEDVTC